MVALTLDSTVIDSENGGDLEVTTTTTADMEVDQTVNSNSIRNRIYLNDRKGCMSDRNRNFFSFRFIP